MFRRSLPSPARRRCWHFLAERGISMAAATSSPRAHVTAALDRLGLLPYLKAGFHHRRGGRQQA